MAIGNEGLLLAPAVLQPHDLRDAWRMKHKLGDESLYISGGTLLRTRWETGAAPIPRYLIDLRSIKGLTGVSMTANHIAIGALSPLSDCRNNALLQRVAPALHEALRSIAAPSVRNLATIGGNVVSGAGDALPALLIYDAELVWFDGRHAAAEPAEDWLRRLKYRSAPEDRILTEIRLRAVDAVGQSGGDGLRKFEAYRKVGRREAFTPSLVTVALSATVDRDGRFTDIRIAAGGGSATPQRLAAAEALLRETILSELTYGSLYMAVYEEYEACPDAFASADYRKKTAGNLVVSEIWSAFAQ
ncbi:FAD binding domain-containing protein [Paenibacillus alkalitolerans]|uniref:FAD binding domain-containing protein n=1 Tax=Paenibacillus alkalitolerans TaxID=2799335 RepID=UPI0018F7B9A6|nr:FAD binding domain-containing protein [Paenibacillus alkalitolerans]